jgi:3-methyladenine DNA glycosylase/8-oxoguanine DNA glycosylase
LNILLTSVGNIDDARHRATVRDWQARHHIVETMPAEHLLGYRSVACWYLWRTLGNKQLG